MQLKYSNYVAFSHFHGKAVNNSGIKINKKEKKEIIPIRDVILTVSAKWIS